MRHARLMTTSFVGSAPDYRTFSLKDNSIKHNRKFTNRFFQKFRKNSKLKPNEMGKPLKNSLDGEVCPIQIASLIKNSNISSKKGYDAKVIAQYIEKMHRNGELKNLQSLCLVKVKQRKKLFLTSIKSN